MSEETVALVLVSPEEAEPVARDEPAEPVS